MGRDKKDDGKRNMTKAIKILFLSYMVISQNIM